jgi:hypothetical protein
MNKALQFAVVLGLIALGFFGLMLIAGAPGWLRPLQPWPHHSSPR